jgi:hypothetical protein
LFELRLLIASEKLMPIRQQMLWIAKLQEQRQSRRIASKSDAVTVDY